MTRILVTDVDRTITTPELIVRDETRERFAQLRDAGVRVVLATGRSLEQLEEMRLVSEADAIVAENGGVTLVGPFGTPHLHDDAFAPRAQAALGPLAGSFSWRQVIASGPRKLAEDAHQALEASGISHDLSFNEDEVMLVPPGVDKASGVQHALRAWDATLGETWAIGDGENDTPILRQARVSAAPSNGHPLARAAAKATTLRAYDEGFLDFTTLLLQDLA